MILNIIASAVIFVERKGKLQLKYFEAVSTKTKSPKSYSKNPPDFGRGSRVAVDETYLGIACTLQYLLLLSTK